MTDYILAIDQGTTSSRSLLVDHIGQVVSTNQREFQQIYPQEGWVEHDPNEIWQSQLWCIEQVMNEVRDSDKIHGIGITNQRETTLIWEKDTGKPIYNAIVWQDRRTAEYCDQLKSEGRTHVIQDKTGLVIDAYFSASKIKWILDHVEGAREKAEAGKLAFGTIDSWLIWNLTNGQEHLTDVSNASRTMIFNINTMTWDDELLDIFEIPKAILPTVKSNSEIYGYAELKGNKIPIGGIAGDQQSALFGQMCIKPGMVKNTYGTGCFIVMNTGSKVVKSQQNLLGTVAWQLNNETTYALEGSIFIGGALVQWLRDGLGFFKDSSEITQLAQTVGSSGGVSIVPAFVGLGAPHWDQYARGIITGLTRDSNRGHIARAALEAIAHQSYDVIKAMEKDSNQDIHELRVDGGASVNDLMIQFQSDILNSQVVRPETLETTALGAAFFAGLAVGFWKDVNEIQKLWKQSRCFTPSMSGEERSRLIQKWDHAVSKCKEH